ncbi:MAG TPA: hypothetical protein VKR06_01070 [Ktedonosporobacter sp.]|nr:hypothetical protein [Ktedonosporobacter sp.]
MKSTINKQVEEPDIQPARPPRRRLRRTFILALLTLVVLLLVGLGGYLVLRPRVQPLSLPALPAHINEADLGLTGWQDYQRPLPPIALNSFDWLQPPTIDSQQALLEDAAGQALIGQGQLVHGLSYLRAAAQSSPDNLRYNDDYRLALRDHGQYAEEEAFFSQQAARIKTPNTAISLAMAYVDEMRACPRPPDGLVCQAQNSSRSIDVLNSVLAQHPYNIIARYGRGLNHLYWPSAMGHLPRAQDDLQYAIALLQPLGSISSTFPPLAYAALGDVFAKDGQVDAARNVWLSGKNALPNAALLDSRLNIALDQLVGEENGPLRGLGVYVDTKLAIFWQSGR